MSKHRVKAILLAAFVLWIATHSRLDAQATGSDDRPNIIIVLCDDLGYGDVNCFAPQTCKVATPHADRLAREGMKFIDAHSASSVCTPTRYGLLTGRYCWRTRLQRGVVTGFGPSLIDSDRPTLGTYLKSQGYHTGVIGKWHLNFDYLDPATGKNLKRKDHKLPPVDSRIPDGPLQRGFDYFHGFHHARDMKAVIENDRVIQHDAVENMLPRLTEKAVQYINQQSQTQPPFFLYLALGSPHTPIVPTEPWLGKSGLGDYGDFVMQTDHALGEVLKAVEKNQLTDDTLIFFTSDNGCSRAAGIDKLAELGHRVSGPLRGSKADLWEGGHRVPLIARWPGRIKPNSQSKQLVCLNDLFATVVELCDDKAPRGSCEDSMSFLHALTDSTSSDTKIRDSLVHHSVSGHFAFRQGSWKLLLARGSGGWSLPNEKQSRNAPQVQLYNLTQDLAEQSNRFGGQTDQAGSMLQQLEAAVSEGRTTPGPPSSNQFSKIDLWKSEPDR